MTSVPPSTPLLQGPLQAPQTPVAVVPDPPEALLKLAPGSRIEGLVLAQAARGSAQVRTDAGTLDLRTSIPLAKGAVLALVLKAVTPQVRVQIAAVGRASPDSVAPPPADAGPGFGRATLSPQSVLPETTIEPAGFAVGTRLIATLSRPALSISGIVGQIHPAEIDGRGAIAGEGRLIAAAVDGGDGDDSVVTRTGGGIIV